MQKCDGASKDPVVRQSIINTFLLRAMAAAAAKGDQSSVKAVER